MTERTYQEDYSKLNPTLYNESIRHEKAMKVITVFKEWNPSLGDLKLLDLSCSTGIMTRLYAEYFGSVVGVDIDIPALEYAKEHQAASNLTYEPGDAMDLGFADNSFDAVTCTQMYEHVPDAFRMMEEVYRVLRPGGVCFFSATNRLKVIENHYGRLPFLSIIPKPLAHIYLRILGRAKYYYETHYTVWGLRRLVKDFEILDYTEKVVADPARFHAADMISPGGFKHRIALSMVRYCYWLFPGYLWLIRKPENAT